MSAVTSEHEGKSDAVRPDLTFTGVAAAIQCKYFLVPRPLHHIIDSWISENGGTYDWHYHLARALKVKVRTINNYIVDHHICYPNDRAFVAQTWALVTSVDPEYYLAALQSFKRVCTVTPKYPPGHWDLPGKQNLDTAAYSGYLILIYRRAS